MSMFNLCFGKSAFAIYRSTRLGYQSFDPIQHVAFLGRGGVRRTSQLKTFVRDLFAHSNPFAVYAEIVLAFPTF
jgi:hypothetical protein